MEKTTNFAKEFRLYENLFSSKGQAKLLKEGYEVTVEGESRIMPDVFYKAIQAINTITDKLEGADVDSYDDHYFDGTNMQWSYKWNIFEPITFNNLTYILMLN
jgi:hypothetical protein